jgi:hypothetical protein
LGGFLLGAALMDYTTYVSDIAQLMTVDASDPDFLAILTAIINAGEQRIYRELDFLATVVTDDSLTLAANARKLTIPTDFIVVNAIGVITPAGATYETGELKPLTPVSVDYINAVWPSTQGASVPTVFAMLTQWDALIGPASDDAYAVHVIGTQRPEPLSAANSTTFLTQYLYDLFLASSMIFGAGYQRDFGAQSDDPRLAASWQQQYDALKTPALVEEARKKFQSSAWSSMSPAPAATPSRG